MPRLNVARIIHSANRCRLGQSINLQHGNTEHLEIKLCLKIERSGAADQRFQIRPNHFFADCGKYHPVGQAKPERIYLPRLSFFCFLIEAAFALRYSSKGTPPALSCSSMALRTRSKSVGTFKK